MHNTHPLSQVVSRLTREHHHTDGERAGTERPLLATLALAVASSGGKGSASGVSRTGSPVDLGALDLLDSITAAVQEGYPGTSETIKRMPLSARLQSWASAAAGSALEERALLHRCLAWEQAIRRMIEPPKEIPLREAVCPACALAWVTEEDPDGDTYVRPALTAYASGEAPRVECCACGTQWKLAELAG